ncbi:MAG: cytochrome P450 [Acidimicrobiia bacterium]|nr:cytochrome P450 [Acidimicrobiia bacterium]
MTKAESFVYEEMDFVTAQPYAQWKRAREECPVIRSDGRLFGVGESLYQVTRHDDAESVLRDAETFSSSINLEHMKRFMGELILGMDGPEHRSYRSLVAPAFRSSQLEKWEDNVIRPSIQMYIDEIATRGKAELVRDVTMRYPVRVICAIVGVPIEDSDQFQEWAQQITQGPIFPEAGLAASKAMSDYLAPLIAQRRITPTGDMISDLVHAEIDGEQLTDERIYGFLKFLLPAGAETTFRALGNALTALLLHPEAMQRVANDRSLVPDLIEEVLRWETSITQVSRIATSDTEIDGCLIPAGSGVAVLVASANHDADHFDDAEDFNLDRASRRHIAFGTGPHMCLGMHLARMEMSVGLNAILDGLPNLRLDPDAPPPVIEGLAFRGPVSLHVLFEPATGRA